MPRSNLDAYADAAMVACPRCRAKVGDPCVYRTCRNGMPGCAYRVCSAWRELPHAHLQRVVAARIKREENP